MLKFSILYKYNKELLRVSCAHREFETHQFIAEKQIFGHVDVESGTFWDFFK